MARQIDHRPDARLGLALGAVLVAGIAGPVVWTLAVRDRLPDEVARHWGLDGQVTGAWPLSVQLWVLAGITLLVAGGLGAAAVLSRQPLALRRSLAGCAAWTTTFVAALQVDGLRVQLDLDEAAVAAPPNAGIAVGAVLGLAVAVAVAAQAREAAHGVRAAAPPPASRPRLAGEPSLPWRRTTPVSRALLIVMAVTVAVVAAPALAGAWALLLLAGVVAAVVLSMSRWTVHIDADGLVVANGPLTLLRVPLSEVAEAWAIEELDPFWEFGGWGLRMDVHGRTGVVGRKGPALALRRGDGTEVVVSVDDAGEAAATLNTLADGLHRAGA